MHPLRWLVLAATVLLAAGCASLPPMAPRAGSSAFTDTAATVIGEAIAPLLAAHPGHSGIHAMPDAFDAFAARAVMAAERGVRVRQLIDDGGTSGIDRTLALLDAHPRIELRLCNPFAWRGSRAVGYLSDFTRLNKRMHNKSFTVDNLASVVGGSNIANEYFGAAGAIGFADLDVLAIGPVVQLVSTKFDRYWSSASAYPATQILAPPPADAAQQLQAAFAAAQADPAAQEYLKAVADSPMLLDLLERRLEMDWTSARLLYDDPAKTLDRSARTDVLLLPALMESMGKPTQSFDIVSPYLVPGAEGTALLAELAHSGVQVRVLTNSLASSDESVVHAGCMKRRADLLRAGVRLFELKPGANRQSLQVRGRFGAGKVAGLHAKTYAVDGGRIFVGSFNFDQRSARLNTELGVVLDSPVGAAELARLFDHEVPQLAYELRLAPQGEGLVWVQRAFPGRETLYDVDPQTDWALRFKVGFLAGLPIEWLL